MKSRTQTIGLLAAAALLAGTGYALYQWGMVRGMAMPGNASPAQSSASADPTSSIAAGEEATRRHIREGLKAGSTDPVNGKTVLYYHDPMVPGKRFDAPAKSPFMDMMLVPVYGGADAQDTGKVTVSPRIQQSLGIRTAEAVQGQLSLQLSAVGNIAWNERDQSVVQARAAGFIERLHVRATLDPVRAGQPFADLYVPEWVAAQGEFLALKASPGAGDALVAAARQRMRQLGMSVEQIAGVEAAGIVQPRTTLRVPSSGVVAELVAREGMTVSAGMLLARINGLASVWALAEVPESQATLVRPGARVEARSPAAPGTVFKGTVQALLPEVSPATRTIRARVQLANPGSTLAPGMFVTLQFMDGPSAPAVLVPTEALITTGRRTVVMLAEDGGRFRAVEVETGREAGGQTEIRKGLAAGQRVVVSSQFLIDSEASLKGLEARLNNEPAAAPTRHQGEGKVEAVGKDTVTLLHGPIPSLKWGTMSMDFKLPPGGLPRNVAAGDPIQFEFVMPKDEGPALTRITPVAPPPAAARAPLAGASR